MVDLFSA